MAQRHRMIQATTLFIAVLAVLLSASSLTLAQQYEAFGQYEVHYSTINTNQLTPQIAQSFGIQRAGTQAMLNITVIDTVTDEPVEAEISVTATNLTGQLRQLDLRELREQEAIYYIGQFRIHNEETLNFEIEIQPSGRSGAPFELEFRHQFFTG